MAEVFWLVSHDPDDDGEGQDGQGWSINLVECRTTWTEAKRRLRELIVAKHHVEAFDDDGQLLWSEETHGWCDREGARDQMAAPRVAGLYRWTDATGHVRVELPPLDTWRRTATALTRQRNGRPV